MMMMMISTGLILPRFDTKVSGFFETKLSISGWLNAVPASLLPPSHHRPGVSCEGRARTLAKRRACLSAFTLSRLGSLNKRTVTKLRGGVCCARVPEAADRSSRWWVRATPVTQLHSLWGRDGLRCFVLRPTSKDITQESRSQITVQWPLCWRRWTIVAASDHEGPSEVLCANTWITLAWLALMNAAAAKM